MFRYFPFMRGGISEVENCNSKGRDTKKMVFPLPVATYLAENLSGLKIFRSLSFIDRELFLFHFHLLPFFGRESFFLFLFYCSFLYFHLFSFISFYFFLFFLFTSPSPFLSLGNWVLALYSLSLEEIPLPFASGERMRILSIGQGSKKSKVVFQWGLLSWEANLDIWGKINLGVKVSLSARTFVLFHKARVTMMI